MSTVLLLNMSTLNQKDNSFYGGMGGTCFFSGVSQLEPGTKELLCKMAQKKQLIDRIIVLNTEKTVNIQRGYEKSAYDTYKDRISSFIKGEDSLYEDNIQAISSDDKMSINKLVCDYKGRINRQSISSEHINKIEKKIEDSFYSQSKEVTIDIDISDEDKDLLLDILENDMDDQSINIEKYERLQEKYFFEKPQGEMTIYDRLKYRESLFAKLRLQYEEQLLLDTRTRKLVKKLYDEINKLHNEIEKITREREHAVKRYITISMMKNLFDFAFKDANKHMEEYRKRILISYESIDTYLSDLFVEKQVTGSEMAHRSDSVAELLQLVMKETIKSSEKKEKCNIYVDIQGGHRSTVNVMNGTVELLKMRKDVDIQNSYAVDYNRDNVVNFIVDVTGTQTIFKLVSAMNEFVNTSRAGTFRQYCDEYYKYRGISANNQPERDVVKAIGEISDSIAICDMISFARNLKNFSKVISKYKGENKEKKDSLFDYFVDDIVLSYGVLLDNHSVLDEIKWCASKELYQQALTIIESSMPKMIFDKKVIYCSEEDISTINSEKTAVPTYKFQNPKNIFVEQYIFNLVDKNENNNTAAINIIKGPINAIKDYFSNQDREIPFNIKKGTNNGKNESFDISVHSNIDNQHTRNVGKMLRLHNALKRCRNMTNHASDNDHPTISNLKNGIGNYISLAESVFKDL